MSDTNQAQRIATKFGGRQSLADALGLPYHRVSDWCRRLGFIPEEYRLPVLQAAEARAIDLTPFEFIRHLVTVPTGAATDV